MSDTRNDWGRSTMSQGQRRCNAINFTTILHTALKLTTKAPYLALTGEVWGVHHEEFEEKWPSYNGTALYLHMVPWSVSIDQFHKSQNALVPYPILLHSEQKCAHFCSEWSIVGYGTGAFWDLWIRSIVALLLFLFTLTDSVWTITM